MPTIAGTFLEHSDSVLKGTSRYLIFNWSVINDHGWWLVDTDFKVLFLDTATWTLMDSYQIRKRYSRPPLPVTRLQQQHVSSNASFSPSISSLIINAYQLSVFSNDHVIFLQQFFLLLFIFHLWKMMCTHLGAVEQIWLNLIELVQSQYFSS